MADLDTAFKIVHADSFAGLRGQIEMGMWVVARDKLAAGATGPERDNATRTLMGGTPAVDVAIRTVATDMTLQQQIIDGGYELGDDVLTSFLSDHWCQMAGVVAGDMSQATS
jgi:hypothetical protein